MGIENDLFEAVRLVCAASVWSQGVGLSRSAKLALESQDEEEVVLKVSTGVGVMTRTVRLFPEDEDWMCDCTPREEICEHIVASVIALKKSSEGGSALPDVGTVLRRVGYRFLRSGRGLILARVLVGTAGEEPLKRSLAAAAADSEGPKLMVLPADLKVDPLIRASESGWVAPTRIPALLKALGDCEDLRLDGVSVRPSERPVGMVVELLDHARGFLLQLAPDPRVTESFSNDVVLCDTTLCPWVRPELTARERQELQQGLVIPRAEVSDLLTNRLPSLKRRIRVVVRTKNLPQETEEQVALLFELEQDGYELTILPLLVYGDPPVARVDGDRLVPFGSRLPMRSALAEQRLTRSLQQRLGLVVGHRLRCSGEEAVAFASRLSHWQSEARPPLQLRGEALSSFTLAPPLRPVLDFSEGHFDLSFNPEGEEGAGPSARGGGAALDMVLSAWRDGASLVPLDQGGWSPLPFDWLERYGAAVSDLLSARQEDGSLPRCVLPELARLCDELSIPAPVEAQALRNRFADFEGLESPDLPSDLQATLRPYQREGVAWLSFLQASELGGMLADDMGLGKTLQALCVVRGRTLVVAPTSVLANWAAEVARFRPSLRVSTYHGPNRSLDASATVTLTTYAILRLDSDALSAVEWDVLVLDEAQAIKNPDSQVARAAYRLQGAFRLTLTGTPVENRLEELWSQLHFTNPGLLGGRRDFDERYARPLAEGEVGTAERLRQRIRPFLLRRLKRDVAPDLPPRTDLVLRCELTPEERRVYEAIRLSTRQDVVERLNQGGSVLAVLEALLRLRQAACHVDLLPGQQAETSSKIERLREVLETVIAEGHKALIFSQWTSLLDRVEPMLSAAGLDFLRLDGSTRNRGAVVDSFQGQDGPPVLLLSLKAGGTGLNLTAADHVFLLDPWWNPAVEDQAADRTHRIGQERPVFVHRLVASGTVEEGILELQQRKRALSDAALDGADQAARLTRDDLLTLLVD